MKGWVKVFAVLFFPVCFYFQDASVNSEEVELRRQAFQKVWQTVNDKHYDETFGGVDWKRIREIYESKAMQAKSRSEFHKILNEMLGELKISHIGILEEEDVSQIVSRSKTGIIGIEVKMINGEAVIFRVEKGSTAEKAGLKVGFSIKEIDGKSVDEILSKIEGYVLSIRASDKLKRLYQERFLQLWLEGEPGTKVVLEVVNEMDQRRTYEIERYKANYELSEQLGNLPPFPVVFEARRVAEKVGYIRFNAWTVPQIQKLRAAIKEFSDTIGLILDLRGNPGGIAGMASGLAGLLVKERISLGTMKGRTVQLNLIAYPQEETYSGKVVILVDHGTGSTSEVFAVGLQENGRAKIIGEETMGAALPSYIEVLPTKAFFQYPIMDYRSPKGIFVEGRGLVPDVKVFQTRKSLLEGKDLPLEMALQEILK
ncbi:MAG: S41 family peptidase [Pyrinomonadaceae bacterium]|nr:S41 family peptidase [Pyrinomonadaceae bacterium]